MTENAPFNALHILESITDGFFVLDRKWYFTYLNEAACRLLGRNQHELQGKCIWDEFPGAVHSEFHKQYHKALEEQITVKFEAYFHPLQAWFDVKGFPIENGLAVIFSNITVQKKSVLQTAHHYNSLFEHHPDAVYSMDLNGNYLTVNLSMQRITGYSEDELLQASFFPLINNSDVRKVIRNFKRAATGAIRNFEVTSIAKNGKHVHLLVSHLPVHVDGDIIGVIGIAKDITGQKTTAAQLKKSEELFQLISNHSQNMISFTSAYGIIRFISPAVKELLGYEPEECIGLSVNALWHPEDLSKLKNAGVYRIKDLDTFACRVLHKNGHYVWIETKVKLLRNQSGEVEQVLGICRDISRQMMAEEELNKTKELLNSFIHNTADAIWVSDLNERVLEINMAFESMFQWQAKEVIGEKLPIIPEFLQDKVQMLHQQVNSGQALVDFETMRNRKDGQYIWVSATISPIRSVDGEVIGLSGVCRDIAERKQAEQALKETKELLESFIHNHIDAVILFNDDGTIQLINESFTTMFGYSQDEVIG